MCLAFCSISAREATKGQQQDYVKGLINGFACTSLPQSREQNLSSGSHPSVGHAQWCFVLAA